MDFYFKVFLNYLKKNHLQLLIIFLVISSTLCIFLFQNKEFEIKEIEQNIIEESKDEENDLNTNNLSQAIKTFYIDVKGYVKNPGVYELDDGKRVLDAIKQAGGVLKNGDTTAINLSKKLFEEMVIYVPKKNEVIKVIENNVVIEENNQEVIIKDDAVIEEEKVIGNTPIEIEEQLPPDKNDETENNKVNINTATVEELMTLNGIGESKAKSIIKYREENNGFKTIEDIKSVSGIGDAAFEKIKDNITV